MVSVLPGAANATLLTVGMTFVLACGDSTRVAPPPPAPILKRTSTKPQPNLRTCELTPGYKTATGHGAGKENEEVGV